MRVSTISSSSPQRTTPADVHIDRIRARSKNFNTPVTTLPEDADWPTLRGHYEKEHPASCERLVVMTPEQIRTKKAENDSKKVPFPFVTKKRKSAP